MNCVMITNKLVNIDCIEFVNFKRDEETGKIYCLYELSSGKVLEEVFTDYEVFNQKMKSIGIFDNEETEKKHILKKLCIMLIENIRKLIGR